MPDGFPKSRYKFKLPSASFSLHLHQYLALSGFKCLPIWDLYMFYHFCFPLYCSAKYFYPFYIFVSLQGSSSVSDLFIILSRFCLLRVFFKILFLVILEGHFIHSAKQSSIIALKIPSSRFVFSRCLCCFLFLSDPFISPLKFS